MDKTTEIRKITILGNVCNVLSVLFTLILCLPLPIVFFFLKKKKTYFSISDNFKKYLVGEVELEVLNDKNNEIIIRLILLTVLAFLALFALIVGNSSNDFEIRGNYIFASTFVILISPCFYQCYVVKKYLKDNLSKNIK